MVKRYLCALLVVVIAACAFVFPASAAVVGYDGICPRCGTVYWQGFAGVTSAYCSNCGCDLQILGGGGGVTRGGGAGRSQMLEYYTGQLNNPSSSPSGAAPSVPTYSTGETKYYQIDNTTNKTLNFTTWNQQTNNYTYNSYTYNNVTYNNEYNYYTYDIDNHYYYVTYNVNYVNIIYPDGTQDEDGNDNYDSVNIFFKLPDGRNSYDLDPEDIYGTYFVYNVVPYQSIPEDDGVTLGLWHLDGDLKDSSANNGAYSFRSTLSTFLDIDDTWGKGLASYSGSTGSSGTYYFDSAIDELDEYTIEFRVFVNSGTLEIGLPYYKSYTYKPGWQGSSGYYPALSLSAGQWYSVAFVRYGDTFSVYSNGILFYSFDLTTVGDVIESETDTTTIKWSFSRINFSSSSSVKIMVDEVRYSNKALYTSNYTYSLQPFDTNQVLVPPADPVEYDIGVFSGYDVPEYRIGGVRPTYPTNGFVWVYLEDDVVQSVQQYQIDGWYSVDARIYVDGTWQDVKGFNLKDAKFEEDSSPEPTPTPTPDPGGPTPTPDPGGPTPSPSPGGDGEIDTSEPGWFDKFLSMLFDGLTALFQTIGVVLGSMLTGIISLLTQVVSGLTQIVGLGGEFTTVIGDLFGWLPSEMQLVVVAGFSVLIFVGLLKLFL